MEQGLIMERTLAILKPTAVERKIIGTIIGIIEDKGLKIVALKMVWLSKEMAETLYEEHREKPFFEKLVKHITSLPIVLMVVKGENAIGALRQICGATDSMKAAPGSIRGKFGLDVTENIIHASDGPESAEREIELFFKEEEIYTY
jgi:nucleoside diphosphate kinase (EC 2.7.4.6)